MDRAAMAEAVRYRELAVSTVEVVALVVPATREVGRVLAGLRGLLYNHRGVRNVLDLSPVPGEDSGPTAVTVGYQDQRWWLSLAGPEPPRSLKALLLDPAVLPASSVARSGAGASIQLAPVPVEATERSRWESETGAPPALAEKLCHIAQGSGDRSNGSKKATSNQATTGRDSGASREDAASLVSFLVGFATVRVELSYLNYTMPELLRMALPSPPSDAGNAGEPAAASSVTPYCYTGEGDGGMNNAQNKPHALVALSGFEQVGHIAHVNLSKAHLPHRYTVGQIILDCNPTVAVVVNKTDAISSEFREFPMEVIAVRSDDEGEAKGTKEAMRGGAANFRTRGLSEDALLTATVRQHGCVFEVPYNRVYWNSRLSHEHTRLVAMMQDSDVLFDAMAGVGPFAVPAAKRGVLVFANDLNPASATYMAINRVKNKIAEQALTVYNWDGRDFLNKVVYDCVMGLHPLPAGRGRKHVVMNLPATAVEFLDVFAPEATEGVGPAERVVLPEHHGWYRRHRWNYRPAQVPCDAIDKSLLLHVYCFSPAANALEDAVEQVERHLGYALEEKNKECVFMVRDVAPQKRMVCVSFTLPDAFWARQRLVDVTGGECDAEQPQQTTRRPRVE